MAAPAVTRPAGRARGGGRARPERRSPNTRLTRRMYAWHRWTGLVSGIFLFVLSATGAVAVFKHEIDRLVTPAMVVAPGSGRVGIDDAVRAVRARFPGERVASVTLSDAPTAAHRVSLDDGSEGREAFVSPYTGVVTGSRTGETVANVIRQTHVRFYYFGWQGRVVVGVFGLALLVSTATGLLIYAPFMKGLAFGQIRWRQRLQLVVADWHKLVGIVALAFNLLIAVTGAVLGLENLTRFAPRAGAAIHADPDPALTASPPAPGEALVGVDEALRLARAALPGMTPASVILPVAGESHYLIYGDYPGRISMKNASWVVLDAASGRTIARHAAPAAPPVMRAYNLIDPLHFGYFGGRVVKVLYCVLGMTSAFLSLTGFALWYLKRRRRRPAAAAPRLAVR